MPDMLVKLYDIKEKAPAEKGGVRFFRPMTPDRTRVVSWVREHFSERWASETETAFFHTPVSCFIAVDTATNEILGFAGYNCTAPDFFGPTGVDEAARGRGIGGVLLMKCLEALREEGYGYAIIGGVGPAAFYEKVCGAKIIEDSTPGIYVDLLKKVVKPE